MTLKVLTPRRFEDERGWFSETWNRAKFAAAGISLEFCQDNQSLSRPVGTLRGLHFQYPPAAENKYVRCTKGAVADVIVDLRPESATYLRHVIVNLSADNGRGLYIPERFAHGFVTLTDDTELIYLISNYYTPGAEGGLPHDDPSLGISWPAEVRVLSDRDRAWKPHSNIGDELKARMNVAVHNRS